MQPRVTPMDFLDSPRASLEPLPGRGPGGWVRKAAAAVLALGLVVPTTMMASRLAGEWRSLMQEEEAVLSTAVVGYRDVYPIHSRAAPPIPWRRMEGDELLIWSGWRKQQGHGWFRLQSGDCDPERIGWPLGRDVARAIDYPALEVGGGQVWDRIPASADVVGMTLGATPCVYPKAILNKVLVVNDEIDGAPFLIYHDPLAIPVPGGDVIVCDPRLDGRRITLASSGFSLDCKHVLYDRGTESLWVDRGEGLVAFSGKHKGRTLPLVRRVNTVHWGDWRSENPESRLLVGSLDRSRGLPAE